MSKKIVKGFKVFNQDWIVEGNSTLAPVVLKKMFPCPCVIVECTSAR